MHEEEYLTRLEVKVPKAIARYSVRKKWTKTGKHVKPAAKRSSNLAGGAIWLAGTSIDTESPELVSVEMLPANGDLNFLI